MKKIIGLLLLTILIFAEQNSTIQVDSKQKEKILLLESENRQLKTVNKNLQNKIEALTLENKIIKETNNTKSIDISSIPKLKINLKQPTNWYLILLPITTIVIVIIGFLITRQQLINTSKENINHTNKTIEHQLELSKKENISQNRKEWIQELRAEIINMLTVLTRVKGFFEQGIENLQSHDKEQMIKDKNEMISKRIKIMLLLNLNEVKHKELNAAITDVVKRVNTKDKDIDRATAIVIAKSQDLLKEEWEKVKSYS